jgi:hypothetical protein
VLETANLCGVSIDVCALTFRCRTCNTKLLTRICAGFAFDVLGLMQRSLLVEQFDAPIKFTYQR